MKRITHLSLIFLVFSITLWGCKEKIDEASPEKQFVWNAMNYWYYWQTSVPELADDMAFFKNEQDFQDYLRDYSDAEAVFEDLIYQDDDFSFFIDDYEEFQDRQQGITKSFGFELGLSYIQNSNNLYGYVQYVVPNSPAERAGLERGDVFRSINGTDLNINNYQSAPSPDVYELGLADYSEGEVTKNGNTITIEAETLTENPIFLSKIIEIGSSKIGYLMYNAFQTNSHEELNELFGYFNSEGIDELILDLRYNGGGAVATSRTLCSMISGLGDSDEFGTYSFNSKRAPQNNATLNFYTEIPIYDENGNRTGEISKNNVSLDRLFVLADYKTASASESVINTLRAYMEVIVIGTQTVGKDDVSITLYDTEAPYFSPENANPGHKMAIQPIVAKLVNANKESENEGFIPDFIVSERQFLNDLPPLGDENEPLLAKALEQISGAPIAKSLQTVSKTQDEVFKVNLSRTNDGMYILPEEAKELDMITPIFNQ
jgi:C-terminal processing protease CtpA/Prc